jgi:glycosyltransferase involved in cell wall biosynthesis
VWAIHNTSLPRNATKRATRLINRGCARLSHWLPRTIVYCSNSARQFHEQLGYDRSKGIVIPNGIDTKQFTPDFTARSDVRRALNLNAENEAIALVARYDSQKDFHTALAAFSNVARARPNARLLLIGHGNEVTNHELVTLCQQLGIFDRVVLIGPVVDVPRIMNAIDLLFISSSFGEALPVVLLESAAMGVPIVTTEVGNIPELNLQPEQVVAPAVPEQLAAAIIKRLAARRDPEEARRLAEIRQTVVTSFSVSDMAKSYADLYRQAANCSRR